MWEIEESDCGGAWNFKADFIPIFIGADYALFADVCKALRDLGLFGGRYFKFEMTKRGE